MRRGLGRNVKKRPPWVTYSLDNAKRMLVNASMSLSSDRVEDRVESRYVESGRGSYWRLRDRLFRIRSNVGVEQLVGLNYLQGGESDPPAEVGVPVRPTPKISGGTGTSLGARGLLGAGTLLLRKRSDRFGIVQKLGFVTSDVAEYTRRCSSGAVYGAYTLNRQGGRAFRGRLRVVEAHSQIGEGGRGSSDTCWLATPLGRPTGGRSPHRNNGGMRLDWDEDICHCHLSARCGLLDWECDRRKFEHGTEKRCNLFGAGSSPCSVIPGFETSVDSVLTPPVVDPDPQVRTDEDVPWNRLGISQGISPVDKPHPRLYQ